MTRPALPSDDASSQLDAGRVARIPIPIPGGTIAALVAGAPDAAPVLLVPGYTGSKEDFAPILPILADAGFRATSIDLPGQYESYGKGDLAGYSVATLGADVRAVAATLGERVHLLGHSFGGLVARAAVIAERERFASLALMGSGPAGIDGGRRARMDQLRPVLAAHGIAAVYEAMEALNAADPGYTPRPPALAAFLRRRFLAGDPAMLLGMGDALIDEPDRVHELAATGLRILVLCGEGDDAWSPDIQAEMARRLEAPYVVVPESVHSPAVENPPVTAGTLLEFWRSAL